MKMGEERLVKQVVMKGSIEYSYNEKNFYNECTNLIDKYNLQPIQELTKKDSKEEIKKKVKSYQIEEMLNSSKEKSKLKEIHEREEWKKLETKKYIKLLRREETEQIFRIRTRMVMVKNNMKSSMLNLNCRLCKEKIETQGHIIEECQNDKIKQLREEMNNIDPINTMLKEKDAFSTEKKILQKLAFFMIKAKKILDEDPN